MAKKTEKKKLPVFKKQDGTPGPGRLFARPGEKSSDAKKRLSEVYKIPKGTKFDKGTNSFVPKGREPAFKVRKPKDPEPTKPGDEQKKGAPGKHGDKTPDLVIDGKEWFLKEDETMADLKKRAKGLKDK